MQKGLFPCKQKGIVLLLALLFLLLLIFIGLTAADNSLLEVKLSHYTQAQQEALNAAEFGLKQAESSLPEASCLDKQISFTDKNYYKDAKWWLSKQVCHGKVSNIIYQFYIEKMQIDNCAYFENKLTGAEYFRITARGESNNQLQKIILQTVYLSPLRKAGTCKGPWHLVVAGRQSWREINSDTTDTTQE